MRFGGKGESKRKEVRNVGFEMPVKIQLATSIKQMDV